jgi:hypothetical protein
LRPVFAAIGIIAARSEPYSAPCSPAIRTARPPTSGENRFPVVIVAPSHRQEPPENPVQFTTATSGCRRTPWGWRCNPRSSSRITVLNFGEVPAKGLHPDAAHLATCVGV